MEDLRKRLEVFPNPNARRDYTIEHTCPEFTAVCPKTGHPDFATLVIRYVPEKHCVELKSLKMYLEGFRDRGIYYEAVTNLILDDLVHATKPRMMTVEGRFNVRGGISSIVVATFDGRKATGRRPSSMLRSRV